MTNRPLSVQAFKEWMSEQKDLTDFFNIGLDKEEDDNVGKVAKAKVNENVLAKKIETDDDVSSLIHEFVENGGTIIDVQDKKVQIEVESGTFTLPIFCIKIQKSQ